MSAEDAPADHILDDEPYMTAEEREKERKQAYNAVPVPEALLYDDGKRKAVPRAVEETEATEEELAQMTPRERQLAKIRERMQRSRNENRRQVIEEDRRDRDPKYKRLQAQREADGDRPQWWKEKNKDDTWKLHVSASDANRSYEKKRKKDDNVKNSFGWNAWNTDAQYRSLEKRVRYVDGNAEEYAELKKELEAKGETEALYPSADTVVGDGSFRESKEQVDRLVYELEAANSRRQNMSRRRQHYEDSDVSYINSENELFNRKIAREFDKYTGEIRHNLERGTAL